MSYPTDQIYLQKQWDRDLADDQAAEEAERWEWYAQHKCPKTHRVTLSVDGEDFNQECCPSCFMKVWKHEGATVLTRIIARLAA